MDGVHALLSFSELVQVYVVVWNAVGRLVWGPRCPIVEVAWQTTIWRLIHIRQSIARHATFAVIASVDRQVASIVHIDGSANSDAIAAIKMPKSVQDLLTHHAKRVHRVIIACKHSSAAPTKPLAIESARRLDVRRVFGVDIGRVVEGVSVDAAGAANRFAEGGTLLIAADLRRERDNGFGGC